FRPIMILTNYIFRQTISNVITSTFVFLGVVWLSQSFKNIKLIISKGAGLSDFFILSAYSFPSWLLIALPFGTFAGCMITYLKLQNDKEIIVMKTAGFSPIKISNPAIFVAFLTSLILLILSHLILPTTYKNFKLLQNEIRNSSRDFNLKDNVFIDLNKNQTIFVNKLNKGNYLKEIFIQDRSTSSKIVEYFSKSGYLSITDNNVTLTLKNGTRVSTDAKNKPTILNFEKYNVKITNDKTEKIEQRVVEYNEYNFFELIKKANEKNSNQGKLLAEAHNRNTIIFLPILYVLIVMVTILNGNYTRKNSGYKIIFGISILFTIQSLIIIIKNAVHSNIYFLPIMYLFPTIMIIIGIVCLQKNINFQNVSISLYKKAIR
ncbi:LptF/LptG family permease, partial [Alphaproteobacteria bacterium]|nr:LptF/LptG family permease [Alphaproteobacteria bacterium]